MIKDTITLFPAFPLGVGSQILIQIPLRNDGLILDGNRVLRTDWVVISVDVFGRITTR